MGCSNSTQAATANSPAKNSPEASKATLLGKEPANGTVIEKVGDVDGSATVSGFVIGCPLDTPYGKGTLEELKQGESNMTYAIVKLGAGFVSVPKENASQWLSVAKPLEKAGGLEVGAALDTPYGKGTVEALKPAGFVSLPATAAEAWIPQNTAAAAPQNAVEEFPVVPGPSPEAPVVVRLPTSDSDSMPPPVLETKEDGERRVSFAAAPELEAQEVSTVGCGRIVKLSQGCANCSESYTKPEEEAIPA